MGNSNNKNNPFSGKASSSYNWYESEQVSGCFLSHSYEYSISSGFLMNGKGNNKRESPSSSPSSEENKLPTKYKLCIEGKFPVWSFYVNEERTMMFECLENDKKEVNHPDDHVFDLNKEGRVDLLAEFHLLAKIVQLVTDNQFGLMFSNAHHFSIALIKQQPSSTSFGGEEIASFNRQDDRQLGASSFHGSYGEKTMHESEVFCSDLDRVYLNFVMRKVEEIIKDQQHSKAPKTN